MNATAYTVRQTESHPDSPYPCSIYGPEGEVAAIRNQGKDTARIAQTLSAAPCLLAALLSTREWVAQYLELPGHRDAALSRLRMIDRAIASADPAFV